MLKTKIIHVDNENQILNVYPPVTLVTSENKENITRSKIEGGNFVSLPVGTIIEVSFDRNNQLLIDSYEKNQSLEVTSEIKENIVTETKELTHTIWGVEEGEVLSPIELKNRSDIKQGILIESSDDNEDGTYPLVMHYVTLANKMDKEGVSVWLNRISKSKRLDIEIGVCRIVRENEFDSKAKLIFKEPIEILLTTIGDKQIIEKVTEIQGEFTFDWYWTKNGRQKKIANGFEIWFNIEKYLK